MTEKTWQKPVVVEIKMDCEINSYGGELPDDGFPPYSFIGQAHNRKETDRAHTAS